MLLHTALFYSMGNNHNEGMAEFASNLWNNYIDLKTDEKLTSVISYFKAEVISDNGDGTLTVRQPYDNNVTVKKSYGADGLSGGDHCVVFSFGGRNANNLIAVASGSANNIGIPDHEYLSQSDILALDALLDNDASGDGGGGGGGSQEPAVPISHIGQIVMSSSLNTENKVKAIYGGVSWSLVTDRFLVGAGSTYSTGETGGSDKHQHQYGFQYQAYYSSTILEQGGSNVGLVDYDANNNTTLTGSGTESTAVSTSVNSAASGGTKTVSAVRELMSAKTSNVSNLPPYKAVYIWERTA